MTTIADYLRDSNGTVHRIYPNSDGELVITTSLWDDIWTDPSYTIPTDQGFTYRTLADSAGTTWYLYPSPTTEGELVLSNALPNVTVGVWNEPIYVPVLTEAEAVSGNEIYLAMADATTDWYVYPNSDGELIISTIEPS